MNKRIQKLRQRSVETDASLSIERALIETELYKENYGKYSIPVLRALTFLELCRRKTIYIGDDELIVGERGPRPKAVPTFPELTCHSVEDFRVLNTREKQRYTISEQDIQEYADKVIPYWQGKTQRERIFKMFYGIFILFYQPEALSEIIVNPPLVRSHFKYFFQVPYAHLDIFIFSVCFASV